MITRLSHLQDKIVSHEDALKRIHVWRMKNRKVVFTNGCFDILHRGHVTYLAEAAELGNRLVIALNTDASVKRQGKGDDRPVNDEASRALVLAALGYVDAVVFFDQDTPLELIRLFQPDVLVKGADYNPAQTDAAAKDYIVGSDIVRNYGGEVVAIPLVDGFSTSEVIRRLKKA